MENGILYLIRIQDNYVSEKYPSGSNATKKQNVTYRTPWNF